MDSVVISLGGSVLVGEDDSSRYIQEVSALLLRLSSEYKLYVVTGGGRIARFYIRTGRSLGASEEKLDLMGIEITRVNARLLIAALGEVACPNPPLNYDEAAERGKDYQVVVMGGVSPGITTDAVSAMLAERVGATRMVNATSVDGAYTADPFKDRDAKRIPQMTHAELVKLVAGTPAGAGPSTVFDRVGSDVLARANIPLAIVSGSNLPNLAKAIAGSEFEGTIVSD
jgi:uridylate kinase